MIKYGRQSNVKYIGKVCQRGKLGGGGKGIRLKIVPRKYKRLIRPDY